MADLSPLLKVISFALTEVATQNKVISGQELVLSRFHTLSPPKIPILKYLTYLQNGAGCDHSCFVVSVILLDRLLKKNPTIKITPNTVHKLCLCSVLTASKFITDRTFPNSVWSSLGGVRLDDLNALEMEFLFHLGFSLVITKEEYKKYNEMIEKKSKLLPFRETSDEGLSQE